MWRRLSANVEEAIFECGGGYLVDLNTVVALASADIEIRLDWQVGAGLTDIVERINTHRHLGVYLSSTFDWSVQINDVCLKASRKLSVLLYVKFLKRNTLDMLYKIIIWSVREGLKN